LTQGEAEQVFFNDPLIATTDRAHSGVEHRYHALGRTESGRLLHIAFTVRGDGTLIRVISARAMSRKESQIYGQEA
jgi:uncharacterized protein